MSYLLAYNPYNTNLFMRTRSIDPAAQDFIDAAGITGDVQQQAINNLVKGLKADGLWSKMKAVYPFVTDNRNLLSYTENLNDLVWNKSGSTVIANNAIAPDGSNTAWRVTRINAIAQGFALRQNITTITAGLEYTFSVYLKAPDLTTTIQVDLGDSVPNPIITLTTEWQLYTFVRVMGGSGGFIDFNIASGDNSYCWFWHPQLELGSTATTYQPMLGSAQAYIASQFKYNLVNPIDSDAAFRLVFNGGWTHSSTGATPNGTNGYADTKLNENTTLALNSIHLSHYSRTNNTLSVCDIGLLDTSITIGTHTITYSSGNAAVRNTDISIGFTATASTAGMFINNRLTGAETKYFYNSSLFNTITSASVQKSNLTYFIGARNNSNTAALFSNRQLSFSTIGDGLTDDEAAALYYHTQVFQTSLSRQVGSPAYAIPVVTDPNAKLYLSAIGSTTNITFNTAIDTFIKGLKADGIYNKMKAVYPFATDNRNILSASENFMSTSWFKYYGTITANSEVAPNGTLTASTLTQVTTDGRVEQTVITTNKEFTASAYVKGNSSSIGKVATIYMWRDGGAEISVMNIILTAEWQRIIFPKTFAITPSNVTFRLDPIETGVAGDSAYIWGTQLEFGSTATPYQPQLGSAQTYFANQFKYNMVNPQDADTAFRLVFNGGWTYSPQGALPNGVNGYADTKLIPSTTLTQNSQSYSIYSRSDTAPGNKRDLGGVLVADLTQDVAVISKWTGDLFYTIIGGSTYPNVTNTDSRGFFLGNRVDASNVKGYKNNTQLINGAQLPGLLTASIFIGARNNAGIGEHYSDKQYAFSHIAGGLSDTEAANLYTRVQILQANLLRQIGAPWYDNGILLLDLYPSASAAYSLRKLRNNYVGGPIKVRRSSDNTEQDIYFDANGNIDTTQLLAFCGASNGFVTTWYDQSGNANDSVQTVATSQPQIVNNGVVININNKPALSFDGLNSRLLNTTLAAGGTQSVFYVKKGANINGSSAVLGFPITVADSQLGIYYWNTPPYNYGFNTWVGDSWGYINANTNFLNQTLEMALFLNGNPSTSGVKLFINNSQISLSQIQGTSIDRTMANGFRIGQGGSNDAQNFDGYFQEIVLWNNDYSNTNRSGIQTNINTYYAIY